MQIGDALRDLILHMEWADSVVWSAVRKTKSADTDKRLADLLNHLHMTQRAFIDVWLAKPLDRSMLRDRTIAESEQLAREAHRDATRFISSLDANALDRPLLLPWAGRLVEAAKNTTLGETILQLTAHSTYHRGQANMRMRELGGEPPLVDYIAWLWTGRPAPIW